MATRGGVRVLGVDPGLTRCGVGVVDGPASRPRMVAHACLRTTTDTPLEQRLLQVHDALVALVEEHRPDVVAVERVLFGVNVRTAMATGQAAGAALLAAARAGVPVVAYSPNDVKLSVTGDGGADKDGVARMVVAQLGLAEAPRPVDVTDALAVAITHLARAGVPGAPTAPFAGPDRPGGRGGGAADWESAIAANPHLRTVGGT